MSPAKPASTPREVLLRMYEVRRVLREAAAEARRIRR